VLGQSDVLSVGNCLWRSCDPEKFNVVSVVEQGVELCQSQNNVYAKIGWKT